MTAPRDPHVVLGILPRATPEEVQHAYQRLVRRYHPDTAVGPGDPDELRAVLAAYAALTARQRDTTPTAADHDTAPGADERGGEPDSTPAPTHQRPTRVPPRGPWPQPDLTSPWPDPPPEPPIRVGPLRWHRRAR